MTTVAYLRSALAGLLCIGCGLVFETDGVCTLIAIPGLIVTVVDAESGSDIIDPSVRVFAQEDAFIEELEAFGSSAEYYGVDERAGRYAVSVVSSSYEPWARADVRVRQENSCQVETRIRARLVPIESP